MAIRYDFVDAPQELTKVFELDSSGKLYGKAVCTSIGVFPYLFADGHIEHELRLPEEVFSDSTLDSIKNVPITLNHPTKLVTDENKEELQVGNTGTEVNHDALFVAVDMAITNKSAIESVVSGTHRALSLGYSCDLEDSAGVWCGVPYTKIQRNIKINHCALVSKARQGDQARIRLDACDAVMDNKDFHMKEDKSMADMRTIQIDSVDYKADDKVIEKYQDLESTVALLKQEKNDAATAMATLQAERDTLKDTVASLEGKISEYKNTKIDESLVNAMVDKKLRIRDAAKKAEVDIKADASDIDVQKAVIMKVFPKANLTDKDSVYIDARFDGAVEFLESSIEKKNDAEVRQVASDIPKNDVSDIVDSKTARVKMIQRLTSKEKEV